MSLFSYLISQAYLLGQSFGPKSEFSLSILPATRSGLHHFVSWSCCKSMRWLTMNRTLLSTIRRLARMSILSFARGKLREWCRIRFILSSWTSMTNQNGIRMAQSLILFLMKLTFLVWASTVSFSVELILWFVILSNISLTTFSSIWSTYIELVLWVLLVLKVAWKRYFPFSNRRISLFFCNSGTNCFAPYSAFIMPRGSENLKAICAIREHDLYIIHQKQAFNSLERKCHLTQALNRFCRMVIKNYAKFLYKRGYLLWIVFWR